MNINYKLSGERVTNISDSKKKINVNYNLIQNIEDYSDLHKKACLNEINFNIYNLNYDDSKKLNLS